MPEDPDENAADIEDGDRVDEEEDEEGEEENENVVDHHTHKKYSKDVDSENQNEIPETDEN